MSDFLRNILRRGAGLAPVVSPRPPDLPEEAMVLAAAEKPAVEAPVSISEASPAAPPIGHSALPQAAKVDEAITLAPTAPNIVRWEARSPAKAKPFVEAAAVPQPIFPPSRQWTAPAVAERPSATPEENLTPPSFATAPRVAPEPVVPAAVAAASPAAVAAASYAALPRQETSEELSALLAEFDQEQPAPTLPEQEISEALPAPPVVFAQEPLTPLVSLPEMSPGPPPIAVAAPAQPSPGLRGAHQDARPEEQPRGDRHVQVTIGRIEILQAAPPPRRQPRGFEDLAAARRYMDRRWY